MKVFVQQPQFLPWAGFWNKIANADVYVMYAGVQYVRLEYMNRVRFMGRWLNLPVHQTLGDLIRDVRIDPKEVRKIAKTLRQECLNKHMPYRQRLVPLVERMEAWENTSFLSLQTWTFKELAEALGITKLDVITDCAVREGDCLQKLEGVFNEYGLQGCTLLGGQNCRKFEYERIPNVGNVLYQELQAGIDPESIVMRLVRDEHPLEYVQQIAEWRP